MRKILLMVIVTVATVVGLGPATANANQVPMVVLPPSGAAHGATYSAWSARWWQWAYQTPVHGPAGQLTPFLVADRTDGQPVAVDCSYGQSGRVWFLAGTYQPSYPNGATTPSYIANRSCTVPAGTTLFFPIINSQWDNINFVGSPPGTLSEQQLRAIAKGDIDGVTTMSATLDGHPVAGLDSPQTTAYRVASPLFHYTLPDDNLLTAAYGAPVAGSVPPPGAVADGIYLLVAPPSAGQHILHWQASALLPESGAFYQDITYRITVARS